MPTEIYKTGYVQTIDGLEIEIVPLKIKYLKQLMAVFELVTLSENEEQTLDILAECVRIAMKQYDPSLSKSVKEIEDNFDLQTIYSILNYSAGLKINADSEKEITQQAKDEESSSSWETLDLAKLETEVFLLGIWKNFDELESSVSIEELMKIIETQRELGYEEKKFMAALKGIDLDSASGESGGKVKGQKEWEDMKARVFSRGRATDSNDILALQGINAQKAGFGIGMGLSYENQIDESKLIKK